MAVTQMRPQGSPKGLELDRIKLLRVPPPSPRVVKAPQTPVRKGQESTPPEMVSKIKILIPIAGVLVLLGALYPLWDQGVIKIPFLESPQTAREFERYETIGPVIASVGKGQHIKVTVKLECRNRKVKDRVSGRLSTLQNELLMILSSDEIRPLLEQKDYQSLKPHLKREINRILKKDSIEDVYFSEIILY